MYKVSVFHPSSHFSFCCLNVLFMHTSVLQYRPLIGLTRLYETFHTFLHSYISHKSSIHQFFLFGLRRSGVFQTSKYICITVIAHGLFITIMGFHFANSNPPLGLGKNITGIGLFFFHVYFYNDKLWPRN